MADTQSALLTNIDGLSQNLQCKTYVTIHKAVVKREI